MRERESTVAGIPIALPPLLHSLPNTVTKAQPEDGGVVAAVDLDTVVISTFETTVEVADVLVGQPQGERTTAFDRESLSSVATSWLPSGDM